MGSTVAVLSIVRWMSKDITTLQVSRELRNDLARLGSKDESFETIIRRLLETVGAKK